MTTKLGPLPEVVQRADHHYHGEGLADAVRAYAAAEVAAERERCAKKAAPEHIPFSDDEWRVRCEVRDSILEA